MDHRDGVLGEARTKKPYRLVPKTDNYSPEVAKLEDERLWGKVWQVHCREQELKKPGDFVVMNIVRDSIIVVKQNDGSLKAFYNVCQHRGRRLKEAAHGNTGASIRCPFHAWRWQIDGQIEYQCDAQDWDGYDNCKAKDVALEEVRLDTWAGWVWVCMDPDAKPLKEFLAPLPEYLDAFELERASIAWHHTLFFPCNWKTVLEAFNEGYHVEGTHPQFMKYGRPVSSSLAFGDHGWFGYPSYGEAFDTEMAQRVDAETASDGVDYRQVLYDQQVELLETLKCLSSVYSVESTKRLFDVLPASASFADAALKALELHQQVVEEDGGVWPKNLNNDAIIKAGTDWHIFPNNIVLPDEDGAQWYRARPNADDPESCIFEIWWLMRFPEGKEPPIEHQVHAKLEDFKGKNFFLEQDFSNMINVQQGIHSRGFKGQRTSPQQEVAVTNFHRALHRYLGLDDNF